MTTPLFFLRESDLVTALGLTLLHFLWQGAALAAALAVLLRLAQAASPALRHALCLVTLIAMVLAPGLTFRSLWQPIADRPRAVAIADSTPPGHVDHAMRPPEAGMPPLPRSSAAPAADFSSASWPPPPPRASVVWENALPWAVGVWLAGVVGLALWHGCSWLGLQRLRRASAAAPAEMAALVAGLGRRLGVRRRVEVRLTERLAAPLVFGLWRPLILMPMAALAGLTPAQLEMILAHELAHVRRQDYAVNLLLTLAETLLFYHPAVWWVGRRLRHERECACDETALRLRPETRAYAEALALLAEQAALGPRAGRFALAAGSLGESSSLLRRVERLLQPRPPRPSWPAGTCGLAAVAMIVLSWIAFHPINAQAEAIPPPARGDIRDRHGVVLATTRVHRDESGRERHERVCPLEAVAAHVLGSARAGAEGDTNIHWEGASGIEKAMDSALQVRTTPDGSPRRGADVFLTLDARIQWLAETTLREAGIGRGAAVILDPRNGEVLAMASVPSFDPNTLMTHPTREAFEELRRDPTEPALNRALVPHAPGSLFKVPSALAIAVAGQADGEVTCTSTFPINNRYFRCWKKGGHGQMNFPSALTQSCNCWFYAKGLAVGIDRLSPFFTALRFGQKTGIELAEEEAGGSVAERRGFEKRYNRNWQEGDTANAVIGQGITAATPLQMAAFYAAVGNGGVLWQPRLVAQVVSTTDPDASRETTAVKTVALTAAGVSSDTLQQVRQALRDTVWSEAGTARAAQSNRITIAGKTGTAQGFRRTTSDSDPDIPENKAWFAGFAPFDSPRYAFCLLAENGVSGGSTLAPVARVLMERLVDLENLTPLPPAKGHFDRVPKE